MGETRDGQNAESVLTPPTACDDCQRDAHVACIGRDTYCTCRCAGVVECDTCGADVILWLDDPDDASFSHGECCTWGYVDYFDGTFRLDLSPAQIDGSGAS